MQTFSSLCPLIVITLYPIVVIKMVIKMYALTIIIQRHSELFQASSTFLSVQKSINRLQGLIAYPLCNSDGLPTTKLDKLLFSLSL